MESHSREEDPQPEQEQELIELEIQGNCVFQDIDDVVVALSSEEQSEEAGNDGLNGTTNTNKAAAVPGWEPKVDMCFQSFGELKFCLESYAQVHAFEFAMSNVYFDATDERSQEWFDQPMAPRRGCFYCKKQRKQNECPVKIYYTITNPKKDGNLKGLKISKIGESGCTHNHPIGEAAAAASSRTLPKNVSRKRKLLQQYDEKKQKEQQRQAAEQQAAARPNVLLQQLPLRNKSVRAKHAYLGQQFERLQAQVVHDDVLFRRLSAILDAEIVFAKRFRLGR